MRPQDQTVEEWLKDYDRGTDMGRAVKDTGGGDFKKVPQGTHRAVCNKVIVLDDQMREYKGEKSIVDQVYIGFEVPDERITYSVDGVEKEGPMVIGKLYTASLSEKANLRKDLEGWRNKSFTKEELKGFDIENVLGKPCQIIVTHREANGNTYANITGIAGWPKGMDALQPEGETIYYDPDHPEVFEKLPKWLQEKVSGAVDRTQGTETEYLSGKNDDDFDDDIPF